MAEKHVVRTGIIIATAGGLLASLLLEPVRAFLGGAWRLATAIPGVIWDVLMASVPVWVLLGVVLVVALVVRRTGHRAPLVEAAPRVRDPLVKVDDPAVLPRLTGLEDAIIRRLAQADGEWLAIDELGGARTKRLRLEQALEHLDNLGLVEEGESDTSERLYGLTGRGRDLVIARGDI